MSSARRCIVLAAASSSGSCSSANEESAASSTMLEDLSILVRSLSILLKTKKYDGTRRDAHKMVACSVGTTSLTTARSRPPPCAAAQMS